jgi:hypothetical protein
MHSIQLTHPFGLLVSGSETSGKTTFVKKLLCYVDAMIDKPPENIVYYQDTFGEIQNLVPGIKFVQGLPENLLDSINPETRNLYVIDDFMGEKDGIISKLFTKKSHHGNLSVIYIVQNLFHHSKEHRTISFNASYLCITKNVRDASEIVHLSKQLYPNNTKFFQQAYQLATKEPYSYLFVDLTPACPDEIRIRSGIFPTDTHYVYQPRV